MPDLRIALLGLDESYAVDVGLRIISSVLKNNGYRVFMLFNIIYKAGNFFKTDSFDPTRDNFAGINSAAKLVSDFISQNKIDLLGISVSTNHFERAVGITDLLKKANPGLFIVWGGVHPTVLPEECMRHTDCICIGEGEVPMLELAKRLSAGSDIFDISGLWFKDKNTLIRNEVGYLTEDINSFPFQDYDLAGHYYISKEDGLTHMDEASLYELLPRYTTKFSPSYTLPVIRGCPYACSYCINSFTNQLYGKYQRKKIVRRRNVGNIIEELVKVKERFPFLESVFFTDDLFVFGEDSEEWLYDFVQQYKTRISLPFMSLMHFSQVNDRVMGLLVSAGLKQLSIGIESGSPNTLRNLYQRYLPLDVIIEKAKIVNKYKQFVVPSYDIILDNPYETEEDLYKTLELILKLPEPFRLGLYSLTFFPGTPIYQKAKSDGIIGDDLRQIYRKHYNNVDKSKYFNQLFLLYEYLPKKYIDFLSCRNNRLNKFLVFMIFLIFKLRILLAFCIYRTRLRLFSKIKHKPLAEINMVEPTI